MKILCTICARGGSKGVPNKNKRRLVGKPLIQHTIDQALSLSKIGLVLVSTDSEEIAEIAKGAGAKVPFLRPRELAQDESPKLPVIQHATNYAMTQMDFLPDYVIDLDPTSPLRTLEDIDGCIALLVNDASCDSVITGYRSNKNPYFNMIENSAEGFARLSKEIPQAVTCRQGAPTVYAMNASIYVWRREMLFTQTHVISHRVKLFEMPEDRSVDIDSEMDFKFVEMILKGRNEISGKV